MAAPKDLEIEDGGGPPESEFVLPHAAVAGVSSGSSREAGQPMLDSRPSAQLCSALGRAKVATKLFLEAFVFGKAKRPALAES